MAFGNTLNLLNPFKSSLNNLLFINSVVCSISSNLSPFRINIVNFLNNFLKYLLNILKNKFIFFKV